MDSLLKHPFLCFAEAYPEYRQLAIDYWSCSDVGGRLKWNASVEELSRQHNLSKTDVPKLAKLAAMAVRLTRRCIGCNSPQEISSRSAITTAAYGDHCCNACLRIRNQARLQQQQEVCDEFWPYTRENSGIDPSENEQYFAHIRAFLSKRACVQSNFEAADERTIAKLLTQQISLERIERAIALGCCRKYVSLLNGTDSGPIFSIAYFREVIEEVRDPEIPSGYWDYVIPELKNLEMKWLKKQKEAADAKYATAAVSKK